MLVTILSDLHIQSASDLAYERLLHHIDRAIGAEHHIVLAGDIFEVLTGSGQYYREKYIAFFDLIRAKSAKGVQIHYIEGNHDFDFETLFQGSPIRITSEGISLTVGTHRLWVDHGDTVDSSDVGYLAWRMFTRSLPVQKFANVLPGAVIEMTGKILARTEARKQSDLPETWDPGRLQSLRLMYRHAADLKFYDGFDWVVMGHCHDLDQHSTSVEGRNCLYLNMGYPKTHRFIIECDASGMRRIPF